MSDPSFCEFDMSLTSTKKSDQLLSLLDSVDGFQTLFDDFQEDSEDQREEQEDSGLREDPDVSQKFRDVESAAVEEEDGGSESFWEFQKDWSSLGKRTEEVTSSKWNQGNKSDVAMTSFTREPASEIMFEHFLTVDVNEEESGLEFNCLICKTSFTLGDELKKHMLQHKTKCNICEKSYASKTWLHKHVSKKHKVTSHLEINKGSKRPFRDNLDAIERRLKIKLETIKEEDLEIPVLPRKDSIMTPLSMMVDCPDWMWAAI